MTYYVSSGTLNLTKPKPSAEIMHTGELGQSYGASTLCYFFSDDCNAFLLTAFTTELREKRVN